MENDLTWLDWDDDDDDDAPPGGSSLCPRVKSAFPRDALIVDGAVQGRLCSMLVDSGSAVTLLSEWLVTVELGYELDVLLALRQSEDIVGPSGEPLELVGALETDLVLRELDRRQSVWVVRGMECDCLVGRDVLLWCSVGLSLTIRPLPHFASLVLRSRMFSDVVVLVPCGLE